MVTAAPHSLLAEDESVIYTLGGLFGASGPHGSTAVAGTAVIQVLQFALIGLGTAASLYTARRITWRRYSTSVRRRTTLTPIAVLVVVLAAANVYLFTMPMAMRMWRSGRPGGNPLPGVPFSEEELERLRGSGRSRARSWSGSSR